MTLCLNLFWLLYQNATDCAAYKHINFVLAVLEAGSPRSWHSDLLVNTLFLVHSDHPLAVSSCGRREKELSRDRNTNPIHEGSA